MKLKLTNLVMSHAAMTVLGAAALSMFLAVPRSYALERKDFPLVQPNGFEKLFESDPKLRLRQERIFEALRNGDYEKFLAVAYHEVDSESLVSEREFAKQVRELSKLTRSRFRRMHGQPKFLNIEGQRAFERVSGKPTDSIIFRTYIAKLEGNRQSGWVHVFYNPDTWAVTRLYVNRSPVKRSFTLPDPDPSDKLHPGKDFPAKRD